MRVAISGSNGLVGSHLKNELKTKYSAEIIRIPRSLLYGSVEELSELISGCEIIIHLSGAPIVCRWTKKNKKRLYDSRVVTTNNLVLAMGKMAVRPKVFISTSAVGIYDTKQIHTEFSSSFSANFLGKVCVDWEKAANESVKLGIRTIILRLGVIVSNRGGIVGQTMPVFRFGIGGKLGNGMQPFPFIHIQDLLHIYLHLINNRNSRGIYNAVAPELVSNYTYTKYLSLAVNRPAIFSVPSFFLKTVMGEASCLLLEGQRVKPKRLLDEGFQFQFSNLKDALSSLFTIKP